MVNVCWVLVLIEGSVNHSQSSWNLCATIEGSVNYSRLFLTSWSDAGRVGQPYSNYLETFVMLEEPADHNQLIYKTTVLRSKAQSIIVSLSWNLGVTFDGSVNHTECILTSWRCNWGSLGHRRLVWKRRCYTRGVSQWHGELILTSWCYTREVDQS